MKNLLLLLEYAYLGSVNLPTEDVAEFKEAAKSLQFNIEFEEPFVQDMSQDLLTQVTANDQDMNSQYSDDTIEPASFEDMEYSAILTQKAGNGRELENIDNIVKGPSAKRRKREVSCTVTKKSQCNFCHRLMRERDRNYHQKFCWKNVDRIKSNCALCPKKFLVPGKLKMHMNHSHPDIL